MTQLEKPQCPHFKFRMEEMKRIRQQYPEITPFELNSEIENRWQLVDKKLKEAQEENYIKEVTNYTIARRNHAARKRIASG